MQLEDYFDFVDPLEIRIKGHRIGPEHVMRYFHEGYSPEQIAQEYPGLSLEKIYATITYYLHNKAEMDTYMAQQDALAEQEYQEYLAQEPSPVVKRLRALKAQISHTETQSDGEGDYVERLRALQAQLAQEQEVE